MDLAVCSDPGSELQPKHHFGRRPPSLCAAHWYATALEARMNGIGPLAAPWGMFPTGGPLVSAKRFVEFVNEVVAAPGVSSTALPDDIRAGTLCAIARRHGFKFVAAQ